MESKYLIAGICGYKIGIPVEYVAGVEIIKPSDDIKCYRDNIETVNFRGREIVFVNLSKKLIDTKESPSILIALQHPFCTLGISVDALEGIYELEEITPLPEVIKKATGGLLENYGFINNRIFFTLSIEPILSLEKFREFESGIAV